MPTSPNRFPSTIHLARDLVRAFMKRKGAAQARRLLEVWGLRLTSRVSCVRAIVTPDSSASRRCVRHKQRDAVVAARYWVQRPYISFDNNNRQGRNSRPVASPGFGRVEETSATGAEGGRGGCRLEAAEGSAGIPGTSVSLRRGYAQDTLKLTLEGNILGKSGTAAGGQGGGGRSCM